MRPSPPPQRPRRQSALTGAFVLLLLLAATVAALTPVAATSLVQYVRGRMSSELVYRPTSGATSPSTSMTLLHAQILRLDELGREVTLRVSGNHICDGCGFQSRVVFYSLPVNESEHAGLPPAATITLPEASDQVSADLRLPLHGDLITYPFDRYDLRLGLVLQTLPAAGQPGAAVTVPPAEALQRFTLTLQEVVPQVDVAAYRSLQTAGASVEPTRPRRPGEPEYLAVVALALERPVYLKVLVVLVVLLVAAGAVYATWVQPMTDLLTKASTLVLGIWGIRSLLLGQLPPHATTIDALLTLIIFLVLGAIALRALYHLHDRTGLRILPGARGPKVISPPPRRPPGVRPERRHPAGDRAGRRAGARAGVIAS